MEEELVFPHKLTLNERKNLTLSGVKELVHLDENQVVLHTPLGLLQVYGQELKLKNLSPDGGQVQLTGQIDALAYEEPGRLSSKRRRK